VRFEKGVFSGVSVGAMEKAEKGKNLLEELCV